MYFTLCPVDICHPLSEIELGILLGRYALDLEEGGVGAGVTLGALVAENAAFGVESTQSIDQRMSPNSEAGSRENGTGRDEAGGPSSIIETPHPTTIHPIEPLLLSNPVRIPSRTEPSSRLT